MTGISPRLSLAAGAGTTLAALLVATGSFFPAAAGAADAAHPTVVELFESQGCSSCPPANANLNAIADRPDILALNFAVTYWDQLGWKDTFAQPAFTARQWDYARAGGRGQVATPQVIVDGRDTVVGNDAQQLAAVIRRSGRGEAGPAISSTAGGVTIAAGSAARAATIWLVRYDPRTQLVPIRAGENGGRTLPHRNVVRSLEALGTWTGRAQSYRIAQLPPTGLREAVLVQEGSGGKILAAHRL
ncbi:DUF1223 domain-containing protein [Sphingomonas sp. AR_OL41]|uniref:DUF1223 domain-containing protein n=1 Tax=Sphingomonas sp. AR_OL41 TaxID=3042729 RepID=UPI002480043C|nr:DUF1223 domain-containing protein [Sphingomonas sp. AR_OL41]MDH7971595.1 DUF1223 domain-containing protein [Sphingomonas sp. AR_OL41]